MSRDEKTSAPSSSAAARVVAYEAEVWTSADDRKDYVSVPVSIWRDAQTGCASALTQAADKARKPTTVRKNQRHLVRVKAEGFDRVMVGPVELMKPKRKRYVASARIRSKVANWP